MTSNKVLVETLRPYLRRHTEATAILSTVLDAWSMDSTDKPATSAKLTQAKEAFGQLAKALQKGDQAGQQHGLVRQELEERTLQAIDALMASAASRPAGHNTPR
jgi:hypothetical protein